MTHKSMVELILSILLKSNMPDFSIRKTKKAHNGISIVLRSRLQDNITERGDK